MPTFKVHGQVYRGKTRICQRVIYKVSNLSFTPRVWYIITISDRSVLAILHHLHTAN